VGSLLLKSVHKRYGAQEVLKDINLEVRDGEFIIFVGPSGCGKSTLLRSIAGLEDVSSGQVLINGDDVTVTPPSKRGIAMVFQSYALYPHLTVKDNMGLGLKQAGMPKAEIETRVSKASAMLSLDPYMARARLKCRAASASASPSPRTGARTGTVPVRRTAIEPRCSTSCSDAA
jgi:multiple sugar transport system ATP-binding protein